MKKALAWIGGATLLTATALAALLAQAETGDQVYVHASDRIVLSAQQKIKLRDAVVDKWPAVEGHTDKLTRHYCVRDCEDLVGGIECEVLCEVCWETRQPQVEYLALKNASRVRKRVSDVDDPVDFERCSLRTATTGDALGLLAVYVESLDDTADVATVVDVTAWLEGNEILARIHDIRVASPSAYMTLERKTWPDGTRKVNRHLGAVVEE